MKVINSYFIVLVLVSFAKLSFSQSEKIDSLKNELLLHTKMDTNRVFLLNRLGFLYYRIDVAKTIEYIEESAALSKELGYKKGEGKSSYIKGITRIVKSDFEEAKQCFDQSIKLYEEIDFKVGISECYNGLGTVNYYQSNNKEAIESYRKSMEIKKGMGRDISAGLINIGNVYAEIGTYDSAVIYYEKALIVERENKDEIGVARLYNNIGLIYNDQINYPLSLEYYNKSLSIYETEGDSLGVSIATNNIGILYKDWGNYDKAITSFNRSLTLNESSGNKKNIAKLFLNYGSVYKLRKEFDTALEYLTDALRISEEIDSKSNILKCLNSIGEIYQLLSNDTIAIQYFEKAVVMNVDIENPSGMCQSLFGKASIYKKQNKYVKGLYEALNVLEISKSHGLIRFEKEAHRLLSEMYEITGNYKQALLSQQQYRILNDSIFNKESIQKFTQLEYEYKYRKRLDSADTRELALTKTVADTNKDLEKSEQDYLFAIIIFLLIAILLGTIIFYLRLRNIKAKTQRIIVEQKLLRSQMTPHFIFNTLSVLQGMILNKEDKKAVSYLAKFSKLLRIILENSREKTVSLSLELTAIESYLALQNLENEECNFNILIDINIEIKAFQVPPMLIQPFVENAIEHAFVNHSGDRVIDVHLSYLNNELICKIKDNGIGIDSKRNRSVNDKNSLSTMITDERLKILSKDFKMNGSIHFEDRKKYNDKGTIVTLLIPHKILNS